MVELYALVIKETQEIVDAHTFSKYWKNYGEVGSTLSGWRPPKKIYTRLRDAKSGFSHIPQQLKPLVEIAVFTKSGVAIDGKILQQIQDDKRSIN